MKIPHMRRISDGCLTRIFIGREVEPHLTFLGVVNYIYSHGDKTIWLGRPNEDHSCDEMGCSSTFHILKWFN